MIAFALVVAAIASGRVGVARIELVGPVRGVTISAGSPASVGETRIVGELLAGERRELDVPVPVHGGTRRVVPEMRWIRDGEDEGTSGSARFLRWVEPGSDRIERVPPGLHARPRPPVEPAQRGSSPGLLLLLPACFVLGLALRRKWVAAAAVGMLGAGAILAIGWPKPPPPSTVSVLEGDTESALWLQVNASFESSGFEPTLLRFGDGAIETDPESAPLVFRVPARESDVWDFSARGARLFTLSALEPGESVFRREENRARRLAQAWFRDGGEWTFRGAWEVGVPLPPPIPGPPPPGWLASGLPQGPAVLLGGEAGSWVRITGL